MPAELIHLASGDHILLADSNLIGRGVDAVVRIDDPSVSRQHASIQRRSSDHWLTDLGSSNHTFVNGLIIRTAQKLVDRDRVRFGSVEFEFLSDHVDSDSPDESTMLRTQVLTREPPLAHSVKVVMLVGDLKEFTNLSSKLTPQELASLINPWYEDCRNLLQKKEAVIDKFIGDCVFAYWHSDGPRARALALEAARELSDSQGRVAVPLQEKLAALGVSFDCRVGLHVGDVAIGGASRGDYTALGDAVNVAFRIEALTRDLDKNILASGDFLDGWPDGASAFEHCGEHQLKGVEQKVVIHAAK